MIGTCNVSHLICNFQSEAYDLQCSINAKEREQRDIEVL